jgi:MFS family permease
MKTKLHPNVWILSIGSFLTDVSTEMLVNLLPLFLYNVLGVRTALIGLIDGVAETTASLTRIYAGALSDRLGKRKWFATGGYAFSTLAKPFLYFASSWGWVLGVRFADRLGKGIRTAPRDALLAGSVLPEQRGYAFGLHRTGDTAGAFTGLAFAGVIIWLSQSSKATLERQTFQMVVLASILPAILAVLILAFGLKEVDTTRRQFKAPAFIEGWRQMDHRFKVFLVVVVLFTLGNSSDSFIILRAQERGLGVLGVIGMLLTFNAVYSLLSSPLGALSDRIGRIRMLLAGWFIYSIVYLGLALSVTAWQVWILFAAYGVFYALTEGTAKALVADLVPQDRRGSAYGLYSAAVGIAALPASFIAGLLWQGIGNWGGFGPAAPFLLGAGLALMSGVLLWRIFLSHPAPGSDKIRS